MPEAAIANDEFTAFWNNVLVAKFERFQDLARGSGSLRRGTT